ncbi:MAG: 2,3-bisphosphoglycerate-independent phosphoglycerate mutase [Pyrinomonadaceae bacterium]|nr:2,3-bisphosphoglycerate-independent phosphoglycerate mutase [Pyrinomonadaceae bacterium]
MRRTLLIFVDGLGIGTRGQHNPLDLLGDDASPLAVFADEEPQLPHDGLLARTDACLGVEGRPQSASGQTTILTGLNAPALLGYHKQGFPNEAMRGIIREHSIFLQLKRAGITPNTFANAYTPRFFETRPRWVSATTVAVEAAGMRFRRLEDLQRGAAVYQDFTNELVIEAGYDVPPRTPAEAADVLAALVAAHRFTLYEYFITDRVGHAQDMDAALRVISNLAAFVRAVVARVDLDETTVVLTSDHGNVEDLSIRNHTRNFVPTLLWGACRREVHAHVRTLADITPAIIETLTAKEATHA